jgi:hypothetical protein
MATGDYITFIPADGQIDPQEILKFLPVMNKADIVTSVYFRRVDAQQRLFASKVLRVLIRLLFATSVRLEGTYMFKKEILEKIRPKSNTFFYNLEFIILASKKGYKIKQITINCQPRVSGISKTFNIITIMKVLYEIVKLSGVSRKIHRDR